MSESTRTQPAGSDAKPGEQPPEQRKNTSDLEALGEHLRAIEGVDSDIADLLANNWQRYLGVVLVILIGAWLWSSYESTQRQRQVQASEWLQGVRLSYRSLQGPAEKPEGEPAKDPETLTSFSKQIELLAASKDSVYGRISRLYSAAEALNRGQIDEAQRQVDAVLAESGTLKPEVDGVRFVHELAGLMQARILLARAPDPANPERSKVTDSLIKLTETARFTGVEAVLMLARIADSDEARTKAQQTATSLANRRPELRDILQRELAEMGMKLE